MSGHRYYQPRKLDTEWTGIQNTLLFNEDWLALDDGCRLLYLQILMIVDRYGNADYDLELIIGKVFIKDLLKGRINLDTLQARFETLINAGMIELYTPSGHDKRRFHVTNHKLGCDFRKFPRPKGPLHPKQTMIGRAMSKQDQGQDMSGTVQDTGGADVTRPDQTKPDQIKKGTDLPNYRLTYPNTQDHGGQGYEIPASEVQALAIAYPGLNIPDTVDAFLAYHRDNIDGPQYPRDQVDAVGKLRGWCKQALARASKAKPAPDADPDAYLIDKPNDTEEDWASCCASLVSDRAGGFDTACILGVMAERWPGREVPS